MAVLYAMYIDNVLKQVKNAKNDSTCKKLQLLHEKCGMKIYKFECNDIKVMRTLLKELHATKVDLDREILDPTKVLGII